MTTVFGKVNYETMLDFSGGNQCNYTASAYFKSNQVFPVNSTPIHLYGLREFSDTQRQLTSKHNELLVS